MDVSVNEALAAFLTARLDEVEEAAKSATPGPWEFEGDDPTDDELFSVYDGIIDLVGVPVAYTRDRQVANGRHMALNNPARVLADVKVWRRLLIEYRSLGLDARYSGTERETGFHLALSLALQAKALVWEDHPDHPGQW